MQVSVAVNKIKDGMAVPQVPEGIAHAVAKSVIGGLGTLEGGGQEQERRKEQELEMCCIVLCFLSIALQSCLVNSLAWESGILPHTPDIFQTSFVQNDEAFSIC